MWPLVLASVLGGLALLATLGWLGARAFADDYRKEGSVVAGARRAVLGDLPRTPETMYLEGVSAGTARPAPFGEPMAVWWEVLTVRHTRSCSGSGGDRTCTTRQEVTERSRSAPAVTVASGGRRGRVSAEGADLDRADDVRSVYPGGRSYPYIERRQRALPADRPLLVVGAFSRAADGTAQVRAVKDVTLLRGGTRDQALSDLRDREGAARTAGRVLAVLAVLLALGAIAFVVVWRRRGRPAPA